jgi:predicted Rossmann-fold nucleotide-binding protein
VLLAVTAPAPIPIEAAKKKALAISAGNSMSVRTGFSMMAVYAHVGHRSVSDSDMVKEGQPARATLRSVSPFPLPGLLAVAQHIGTANLSFALVQGRRQMAAEALKRRHRASAQRRRRVVAVIGSGTAAELDACRQIGRLVAELGCDLLTGAGGGTMEAVARAFCERRDELSSAALSIGIVPGAIGADGRYATKPGYPNPWVELAIYTHLPRSGADGKDMLSRNHINVLSADAIVVLPGGAGTQSEVELARQYGVAAIAYGRQTPDGVEHATQVGRVREFLVGQLSPK